jgi:hypothetical protein
MIFGFISLLVATLGVWIAQNHWITTSYGEDVRERFLEHCNYIPSQKPALLSYDTLKIWLDDSAHARDAAGYVVPVLFPWDIVFLLVLGCLLGLGSVVFANSSPALASIPSWIWWILPVAYMVADTLEDVLIGLLFKARVSLTPASYRTLNRLTRLKLLTVNSSFAQLAFLIFLAILLRIYS